MRIFTGIPAILLCFIIVASSLCVNVCAEDTQTEDTQTEETVIVGDLNSDGIVDTNDAQIVLQMAARILPADFEKGDVDEDGYVSVKDAIAVLRKAAEPPADSEEGGVVIPEKNGDNCISFDADNEFIKLVVDEFGVDPDALVAIYSEPDSGTNYVLQFKKSIIGNTYEMSVDNLYRVYHIGVAPEREMSYTNGKLILGEHYNCDAGTGVLVFNLVQTQVMPQYPQYFEGV